jgi:RNA polymerase sigma-70 factor (ECF subfamily)
VDRASRRRAAAAPAEDAAPADASASATASSAASASSSETASGETAPGESASGETARETEQAAEQKAERRLVRRVVAGERAAFLTLIERYERLVQHVVYRMVRDDRDREELCQDVFVRVHRYLDSFRFEAKLSTWIARIARNTCLNHLEKKEVLLYADHAPTPDGTPPDMRDAFARLPADAASPAERTADRDVRTAVHDALDRLPEPYRTALTLYHLEGMSVREVARAMDNPPGTVKSHLYRARKRLKDGLLDAFAEDDLRPWMD